MKRLKSSAAGFITVCSLLIMVLLVIITLWEGQSTKKDTDSAVRTVSILYLDELAGRREQVVGNNLQNSIRTIHVAIDLLTEDDLSDKAHLEAYQLRMKKLYELEKFAFVDTDGLIYTSVGTQNNINDYGFDYKTISDAEISVLNLNSTNKKVIIAVPVNISFGDKTFTVCFEEINMDVMLSGVSMDSGNDATFCNIYTNDGIALSNTVLGGLSSEDNLLEAMKKAEYEDGYSYEAFVDAFQSEKRSSVSFSYKDIQETLCFTPVKGTNWRLTYLVRESVISDKIGYISRDIMRRSILQSVIIIVAIIGLFTFVLIQIKRNTKLDLERKTAKLKSEVNRRNWNSASNCRSS